MFSNFNGIHESIDTIVLVASGLQMSIPFLSFAIVQGGVGSFDNISQNTASIDNKSGFKPDFNQLHQEGATQVQRADGSMIKTFADGNSSISSGAGINTSSGARAVSMESAKNASLNEGITKGLSAIKSDEQHYQERQAAGENLNFDTTTEEGKTTM